MEASMGMVSAIEVPIPSFVESVQSEFEKRKVLNDRYSLRAFARDVKVEASLLSKILRGQYRLTPQMVIRIGTSIGMSSHQITQYCSTLNEIILKKEFVKIEDPTFEAISSWFYFAILRGFDIPGFQEALPRVREKLGLTEAELEKCLNTLKDLGLLIEDRGRLRRTSKQLSTFPSDRTTEANKKLQHEFLEQAALSIDDIPIEERNHTTLTFSVDPKLLPGLKEDITRFRKQIAHFVSSRSEQDSAVYNMTISLYPLFTTKDFK